VNPRNFFVELKRRNVYKVAVAYAVDPDSGFQRAKPRWTSVDGSAEGAALFSTKLKA
jgi:hypothetical protein